MLCLELHNERHVGRALLCSTIPPPLPLTALLPRDAPSLLTTVLPSISSLCPATPLGLLWLAFSCCIAAAASAVHPFLHLLHPLKPAAGLPIESRALGCALKLYLM